MKRLFTLLLSLTTLLSLSAQTPKKESSEPLNEISIDSVEVSVDRIGRPAEVSIGTRVSTIGSEVILENRTRSLSELLSENSMVYIKSHGQGAYSTSSFRGTSSGHTQVNWNGITINPSMSSSFDFSQIPVFFADNVSLYHGNSYIKNGTGALGGSVNIDNTPQWNDTTKVMAFSEYGSNNTFTEAASVRIVRDKALYQTRLYYQQSDNDYRYLNKVYSKDPFYERRKDAQYKQTGLMQEAYFRPNKYTTISNNLWMQWGKRRLPQPLTISSPQHEQQDESGLKYMFDYTHEKGAHRLSLKAGYILDLFTYQKWSDSEIYPFHEETFNRSQSINVIADHSYRASKKWTLNTSLRYAYDFITAESYSESITDRNTLSLQEGVLFKANDWLSFNGQVMGELQNNHLAPTFSVGGSATLLPKLALKANISYNYKFPSMNDLYWEPGGNPDLLPEKGYTYDLTLAYNPKLAESVYLKTEVTGYWMNVDNWIMWLPTMSWFWAPTNVQNVLSRGVEALAQVTWVCGDMTLRGSANYTYASSINREKNFEDDHTYGSQLPYVPLNKANGRLGVEYKGLKFTYSINYIGERFTTADESYSTNAYTIHDAKISYDLRLAKRYRLTPSVRVDNLFDAYYESTQYYPMPLRMIFANLLFTF